MIRPNRFLKPVRSPLKAEKSQIQPLIRINRHFYWLRLFYSICHFLDDGKKAKSFSLAPIEVEIPSRFFYEMD
jgi:hypothetical protein